MPNARDVSPLFEPLGVETRHWGAPLYWFRIDSKARRFQASEMQCLPFLLELYANADHWRNVFPSDRRGRIDCLRAAAFFTKACRDLGEFRPDGNVSSYVYVPRPLGLSGGAAESVPQLEQSET